MSGLFGGVKATPKAHQFPTTPETPSGKLPVHHFRVPGYSKEFCLRKRSAGRFEPWYLVSEIRGRRFHHSLETHEIKAAEMTARMKYILPAMREDWQAVEAGKLKRKFATLGELFAAWKALALGAGEAHKRQVVNQVRNVLRLAGAESGDGASCGVFAEKLAVDYFAAVNREAEAEASQIEAARRKRTGIRTWAQAVCVVQPMARVAYRQKKLELPDVVPMLEVGLLNIRRMKRETKIEQPPPDFALMGKLLAEWPTRPWNEFAAVGLALAFGLRAGEWSAARWDWFKCEEGRWRCSAVADVKNKTGRIEVAALNPFFSTLRARGLADGVWGLGDGFVIEGTDAHRERVVETEVSAWMRAAGWKEQKTNHAFRAYAGALVVLKWGHATAKDWLRHANVATTERHYTDKWTKANKERKAEVEWARGES